MFYICTTEKIYNITFTLFTIILHTRSDISFFPLMLLKLLNHRYLTLPRWTAVAAFAGLLATVIAPLTAQLGEVIQPSAVRFRRYVTVPNFLFDTLTGLRTRARRSCLAGSQTSVITAIQTSYVTLAITRRYARLRTTASVWCTTVSCVTILD